MRIRVVEVEVEHLYHADGRQNGLASVSSYQHHHPMTQSSLAKGVMRMRMMMMRRRIIRSMLTITMAMTTTVTTSRINHIVCRHDW